MATKDKMTTMTTYMTTMTHRSGSPGGVRNTYLTTPPVYPIAGAGIVVTTLPQ